ncbi:MAG TPA: hypothetical protein VL283_05155 [Candidatus Baltobacteraceae bacterium]|jgi:hypothetical protein|nr:hypothetical protein [Candidatus Baltobacteraceae bacterium]
MATRGAKPYFSFLMFAFLMGTLAAAGQAIVAWRHPEAIGHAAMFASAQGGSWGFWIHFGILGLATLVCFALCAYSFMQRRYGMGFLAFLFTAAFPAVPVLPAMPSLIGVGGSLVLFIVCLKITDVLDRRASVPKTPAKKAG